MICPKCGASQRDEYLFCTQCGESLLEKAKPEPQVEPETLEKRADLQHQNDEGLRTRTPEVASAPAVRYRVVQLMRGGGVPKEFLVVENGLRVGSEEGDIVIKDDPLVSGCHAIYYYGADGLRVKDLDSLNGVYYKVREKTKLTDGMMFLCGEVYFKASFEKGKQKVSEKFLGSIVKLPPLYLHIIYEGGAVEEIYPVFESPFKIGRENCSVNFPNDKYLSRHHADIILKDNEAWLVDNKSKNGTFVRIDGEKVLENGDLLFIGNLLFRIEAV